MEEVEVQQILEESSLVEVEQSTEIQNEVLIKLENVHNDLVSIDTTLKYILILALLVIGIRIAWWIAWDLVVKHFQ